MKKIVILGSTGSVGINALKIIKAYKNDYEVIGLTANKNIDLLAKQVNLFKPRLVAINDASSYKPLKEKLKSNYKILKGIEGVSEVASMREADIVLVAISGTIAILPLIAAIKCGKRIALANKEAIVSAGEIITDLARSKNSEIIPVDSEHSSIFQCIKDEDKEKIKKIFLLGSGGPLKDVSKNLFDKLKPSVVLKHPVWKMGQKISVDSATMMNKGLEVIEASYLFGIDVSKIEVLIHREAYMHSMVEFVDGNFMANLFYPDMRMPIFYAFNYPKRKPFSMKKLDFSKIKSFSFQSPDKHKFPALDLCYKTVKKQGTYPACLNGANEEAVNSYLEGKINFPGIIDTVQKVISKHKSVRHPSVDEILYTDKWAKEEVRRITG